MSTFLFNTTLKCSGCVDKIKPLFDQQEGIQKWSVNLNAHPRQLTVETNSLQPKDILHLLEKAGYKGELQA